MKIKPFTILLFLLFFTHVSQAQLSLIHAQMGECTGEALLAHQPNGVSWNWKKDGVLQQYGGYYLRYLCVGDYTAELMQNDSLTIYSFSIDSVENAYPCGSYFFGWPNYQTTVNGCDGMAAINANGNVYDQMVSIPAIDSNQISFVNGSVYLTGLCDENYAITFSDTLSGCSSTANINIFSVAHCNGFALTMHTVQPNTTINTCDGSLYAEVTGGHQPYAYEWEGMNNYTDTITDLCFGFYSVIVTDALGCTTEQTFYSLTDSLLNPVYEYLAFPLPFPTTADSLCDGGVEMIVGGGVPPYTFQHSNGDSLQIIFGLCPGIYSVLVIDANHDTLHVDYIIYSPGSSSIGSNYPDSLIVDSLYSDLIDFCMIDYSNIDYIYIQDFTNYDMDSLSVTWAVVLSAGDTAYLTHVYNQALSPGVGYVTLNLYCTQKSIGNYWFASEQLYLSESPLGMEELKNNEALISQLTGTNTILIRLPSEQYAEIQLYDLTGKVITHQKMYGDHFEMGLPSMASGNYIIELQYTGNTIRKLVQH